MNKIAIIPARGGSKRIPKKNIKDFLGKPIITYSIKAALQSSLFDIVMVSTDDAEIAKISRKEGAEVPFMRSEINANDFATTADVMIEVIEQYAHLGIQFASACCLYPTAPFVTAQKLKESYYLFENKKFDTLFPVTRFSYPIQRALLLGSDSRMRMFQPENLNKRSQDLEATYHDVGQFYWFRPDKLTLFKKLWSNNSGVVIYPDTEVQDIDNLIDWKLAEIKYTLQNEV